MKFETSFVARADRHHGVVIMLLWLMSLLIVAYSGFFYMQLAEKRAKTEEYNKTRHKLARKLEEMGGKVHGAQITDKIAALNVRVKSLDALVAEKGLPVEVLLHLLENNLPKRVYIKSLTYKKNSGKAMLTLESVHELQVNRFLEKIESHVRLHKVRMIKKERIRRNNTDYINADVSFYLYAGNAGV